VKVCNRFVIAIVAAVILAAGGSTTAGAQMRDVLIGGGAVTGLYYQVAFQTCGLMNRYAGDRYNCIGRPAFGSVFNIEAVNRGLLDFAVAQADRNWQAVNGEAEWDGKPVAALRSVFSAYPEAVLVVTRRDSGIRKIEDLKGRVVNIGNARSGQRGNALDLLPLYGIDPLRDIRAEGLQQGEASSALVDRKIDAFIYTVGVPSPAIDVPANATEIAILDVNSDAIRRFVADKPYYRLVRYPEGTFRGVDSFETYVTTATVVTRADVDAQLVYDYVRTVFENLEELRGTNAAFRMLTPQGMLRDLAAPLHPGAARYYKEIGLM
jgi:hypothetical protein